MRPLSPPWRRQRDPTSVLFSRNRNVEMAFTCSRLTIEDSGSDVVWTMDGDLFQPNHLLVVLAIKAHWLHSPTLLVLHWSNLNWGIFDLGVGSVVISHRRIISFRSVKLWRPINHDAKPSKTCSQVCKLLIWVPWPSKRILATHCMSANGASLTPHRSTRCDQYLEPWRYKRQLTIAYTRGNVIPEPTL